ncbi:MAG: Lrp/AsnC family transcriptional regulator [Proteobacteria bacterium]|nr:Lrp/AsnC family transcriptional regulator [Pseudomonadota bacterium]
MPTRHAPDALDEADIRILAALQQDASIANQDLAALVHLSPAPCLRRVRRLREQGYVQSVVALLDREKLGLEVAAYAFVTLDTHRTGAGEQFEQLVRRRPEVVECVRLSGSYDYLTRVIVESMAAYSEFLDRQLLRLPSVRSVNTSFELGVLKRTTALPLLAARPPRSPRPP